MTTYRVLDGPLKGETIETDATLYAGIARGPGGAEREYVYEVDRHAGTASLTTLTLTDLHDPPPPPDPGQEPQLGFATTEQLLDEVVARVEVHLPVNTRNAILVRLGDVKEAISKADPGALGHRTVDQ